jgi:tRNA-dependent cyclodipeptide synthase
MDYKTIIEDFDWSQLSFEQLKLVNSKISVVIKQKKSDSRPPQVEEIVQRLHGQNYKVSVSQVCPQHMRNSLSNHQKCFLGISLSGNKNCDGARLEACIKWISKRFKTCLVFIGDSLHRHTIEITSGLEGNSARFEALHMGRKFLDRHRTLFDCYSGSCSFELMMASEVEKRPDFELYLEQLQHLYRENKPFETTVRSFVQAYLDRGDKVTEEQADEFSRLEHLSASYLLEESAIFACLVKDGWPVMVYPGSIKPLEDIVEGKHPEVPEPLRQMTWVSLRLKKAGVQFVPDSLEVPAPTIEHPVAV